MESFPECFRKILCLRDILYSVVCAVLLICIIIPLITLLSLPFVIYRKIAEVFVPLKMVHPIGQIFAHDYFLEKNPRFNIVFAGTVEGEVPLEKLREVVETVLIPKQRVTNAAQNIPKLLYPELTHKCVKIGGYFYWKPIPNFKASDYVSEWDFSKNLKKQDKFGTSRSKNDFKNVVSELITRNWDVDRSPWEIFLIHNYVDVIDEANDRKSRQNSNSPRTVFIITTHHFMMDGHSLFNVILSLLTGNLEYNVKINPKNINQSEETPRGGDGGCCKLFKCIPLSVIGKLPYDLLQTYCNPIKDENLWRLPLPIEPDIRNPTDVENPRITTGGKRYTNWSRGVSIQDVKIIKNALGVSFQSVLYAVVTKAVLNLMTFSVNGEHAIIPEDISSVVPIPLTGHPGGLENYYGFTFTHLPISEDDPEERVYRSHTQLTSVAKKPIHLKLSYKLYNFCGIFPTFLTHRLLRVDMGHTVNFGTFPGITGPAYLCGHEFLSSFNTVGTCAGRAGATLSALSCFGNIRFAIHIDSSVFPKEENLEYFDEFIHNEIKLLLEIAQRKNSKPINTDIDDGRAEYLIEDEVKDASKYLLSAL